MNDVICKIKSIEMDGLRRVFFSVCYYFLINLLISLSYVYVILNPPIKIKIK